MKRVALGLIGAGRIGKLHAENILRMSDAQLKAITDPFLDTEWAESRGLSVAPDVGALWSDPGIDGVLVLSPSRFHVEQIIQAARAGKHVFCEKPVALDPAQIEEAMEAVRRHGVKLQVGFNRRFDPNFARLRQAVQAETIGRLYLIRISSRDPAPPPMDYLKGSGGIFLDMTIHDFDMVRYLSGSEVEEVYAAGAVLVDPAIGGIGDLDTAVTTLRLKNGALATIDNSRRAVYGYDQRIEVFGSRGSCAADNETPTRTVFTGERGAVSDKPLHFFLERYQESFVTEIREFVGCIREDREPPVGGFDGLAATRIALAAEKSAAEGVPVRVEG